MFSSKWCEFFQGNFQGKEIKRSEFSIDTLEKYYKISRVLDIKAHAGFYYNYDPDNINYKNFEVDSLIYIPEEELKDTIIFDNYAKYYNYNDSLHLIFCRHRLFDTTIKQYCCYNQAIIAIKDYNSLFYYANFNRFEKSNLFILNNFIYLRDKVGNDNYKEFIDCLIIINRNNFSLNKVHKFLMEIIIYVDQKEEYLRVITAGVEYRKYLPYQIARFLGSHQPPGDFDINDNVKEYLFDQKLNLISEKEIEY